MLPFDQSVFDDVVSTMRVNGKRLTSHINHYRHDADKTAIGSLVPDADYNERIEGKSLFDLADDNQNLVPAPMRAVVRENLAMLAHLRTVEYAVMPGEWEENLESFARLHGLLYIEQGELE